MTNVSRRTMMGIAGVSAAAMGLGVPEIGRAKTGDGKYTLPPLPYSPDDLEPHLDGKTLRIHHGKHHAGYVKGLNNTLESLAEARKQNSQANVRKLLRALAFHGSGHILHTLYFGNLSPRPGKPQGALKQAIDKDYGGFSSLEAEIAAAARTVAGSGWAVLAYEPFGGKLLVLQVEKHENQVFTGTIPVLAVDVWEHAYYLKYQNRRADYVDALLKVVDWKTVSKRFEKASSFSP